MDYDLRLLCGSPAAFALALRTSEYFPQQFLWICSSFNKKLENSAECHVFKSSRALNTLSHTPLSLRQAVKEVIVATKKVALYFEDVAWELVLDCFTLSSSTFAQFIFILFFVYISVLLLLHSHSSSSLQSVHSQGEL